MLGQAANNGDTIRRPAVKSVQICGIYVLLYCIPLVFALQGCSRQRYRLAADSDALHLLQSRQTDAAWNLPIRAIEADPTSRMADFNSADCPALPPDDFAAKPFRENPYRFENRAYWDKLGRLDEIESQHWRAYLPYNENGEVEFKRDNVARLAFLNSRAYQTQLEGLYTQALSLSLTRFDLDTQWFAGFGTNFTTSGDASNQLLRQNHAVGFNRNLASGGQLLANFANALVWQFGPGGVSTAGSNLVVGLSQPLLRGAFRHVRLENLSLQERRLLYSVRDFARFRRQFYFDVVTAYLSLVSQQQSLRNAELNLESLQRNLDEHQELFRQGMVSPIQVDQVFQQFQAGRLNVLATSQRLQDAEDQFKVQLGLPPTLSITFDQAFLKSFVLNDPKLDEVEEEIDQVYRQLLFYLPPDVPPQETLNQTVAKLEPIVAELQSILPQIEEEFRQWQSKLEADTANGVGPYDRLDLELQQKLAVRIEGVLNGLRENLNEDLQLAQRLAAGDFNIPRSRDRQTNDEDDEISAREEDEFRFDDGTGNSKLSPEEKVAIRNWGQLQRFIGRDLRERIGSLLVAQTQIRLFLIQLNEIEVDSDLTIQLALQSRLDLMNSKAQVNDAARAVEVSADALESNLTVNGQVNLATDPAKNNSLRFDSSAASYSTGLQFDGPLNRMSERNNFRTQQIQHQQARRQYMQNEDLIVLQIRSDLRSLERTRRNFQIARQQLITAARQVEEAQLRLRNATQGGDSSLTQDLLQALQGLLSARDNLISSWVSFESQRINLFVDTEQLQLDDNGAWINERQEFSTGRTENSPDTEEITTRKGFETDDDSGPPSEAAEGIQLESPNNDQRINGIRLPQIFR